MNVYADKCDSQTKSNLLKEANLIKVDYDENEKQWELSRNRMIEKTINAIKIGVEYMNED